MESLYSRISDTNPKITKLKFSDDLQTVTELELNGIAVPLIQKCEPVQITVGEDSITMSCDTEDAVILYNTTGDVSYGDTVYDDGITLPEETTTYYAIAVKEGLLNSDEVEKEVEIEEE